MSYTDQQLQLALAKMLPERIHEFPDTVFHWVERGYSKGVIKNTEWLHVCWLVELTLVSIKQQDTYRDELCELFYKHNKHHTQICSASWQQRATALCKVKGIEP